MHASGSITYTGNSKITQTQTETPQNPLAVWITPTEDIRHLSNTQLLFILFNQGSPPAFYPTFTFPHFKNKKQQPTPPPRPLRDGQVCEPACRASWWHRLIYRAVRGFLWPEGGLCTCAEHTIPVMWWNRHQEDGDTTDWEPTGTDETHEQVVSLSPVPPSLT